MFIFKIWSGNQFQDGVAEKERVFAVVESEAHFVKVGWKMFDADFMPCSHDASLQEREGGFDGVGMNVTHDVDMALVLDGLVARHSSSAHSVWVRGPFIYRICTDLGLTWLG